MKYFRELYGARELLYNLTLREVRGQYKRTLFGQLWSLVNPLAMMLVYSIVFGLFLRVLPPVGSPSEMNSYPLWLLSGLLPWGFFAGAVSRGMGGLVGNAALIQKVYFPRITIPVSLVTASAYTFLIEMGVLLVVMLFAGSRPLLYLPFIMIAMLFFAAFTLGITLMLSIANVHFRDTQYFMGLILMIWMYLSPVVYPVSLVADQLQRVGGIFGTNLTLFDIYMLNPIAHFLEVFRNLLYDNRLPNLGDSVFAALSSLILLMLGLVIFRKNEKGLAEAL